VIHRDLKPTNIMVGSFGEVQVMDWGLAKVLTRPRDERREAEPAHAAVAEASTGPEVDLSRADRIMGTPSYMAPEQAGYGARRVDERSDVFALGSILSEILTGRRSRGTTRARSCADWYEGTWPTPSTDSIRAAPTRTWSRWPGGVWRRSLRSGPMTPARLRRP
jgi:serine/threonine protein kinase